MKIFAIRKLIQIFYGKLPQPQLNCFLFILLSEHTEKEPTQSCNKSAAATFVENTVQLRKAWRKKQFTLLIFIASVTWCFKFLTCFAFQRTGENRLSSVGPPVIHKDSSCGQRGIKYFHFVCLFSCLYLFEHVHKWGRCFGIHTYVFISIYTCIWYILKQQ